MEPIDSLWRATRAWIPADDDVFPTGTPELRDQGTDTPGHTPEIDSEDGSTPVVGDS